MTDQDPTGRQPRVEAIPLRWSDEDAAEQPTLTETQRAAARTLWTFFRDYYLDGAPARSRYDDSRGRRHNNGIGSALPLIDDQRRNQVLLLDGARGSGKTALLVTLLDAWNRAVTRDREVQASGLREVCDEEGRVMPLALLDLQSLPKDTSLLLHLAGHLRPIAEKLGVHRTRKDPAISPHHPGTEDAQHDWDRFLAAVASSEQQMRKRSAELDPESFAHELHDSESDRLHVGDRFARVIDRLVGAEEQRRRRTNGRRTSKNGERQDSPVFVIAIDDADMNPARLGECFELLTTLVHPRLVFILTGESDLFLTTLRAQFLGDLRKPLKGALLAAPERARLKSVDKGFTLAQRYFDKLIPPSHRCRLDELPPTERIERMQAQLERISLGEATIATVFSKLPALGALLPGHLRELAEFREELDGLVRRGNRAPLESLLVLKDRVKRELEVEECDEFDVDNLVSTGGMAVFDKEPPVRLTTLPLWTVTELDEYAVRKDERGLAHTTLWYSARFSVRRRDQNEGPPESPDEALRGRLDDRVLMLALLIEYVAPALPFHRGPFKSSLLFRIPLPGQELSPMTTRLLLPGAGLYTASWPHLKIPQEGWRSLEVERLWRRALDQIIGPKELDDDVLELAALNYVNIYIHASGATLQDADPPVLLPHVEERENAWKELLLREKAPARHSERWPATLLLRFAHPESRLSPEAAGRFLNAWTSTHSPVKGLEEYSSIEALLRSSERERWDRLTKNADTQRTSARQLRKAFETRFEEHPWTQRLLGLIGEDVVAPLSSALKRAKVHSANISAWLPESAAGYLDKASRDRLGSAGPNEIDPIAENLRHYMELWGLPEKALFFTWQNAYPKQQGALVWNDFVVRAAFPPVIRPRRENIPRPTPTATMGLAWLAYLGEVHDIPDESEHVAGLYRIVHDFVSDRRLGSRDTQSRGWALLQTYRDEQESREPQRPWPAVQWQTFVDCDVIVQRWRWIVEDEEFTEEKLGALARRYIEAQVRTFETRDLAPARTPPMGWQEVFEYARDQLEESPPEMARTHAFKSWVEELTSFSHSDAGLPLIESAAAFAAYLEIIAPLVGVERTRLRRGDGRTPVPLDEAVQLEDAVPDLQTLRDCRSFLSDLRARFEPEDPAFFTPPSRRKAAIQELRAALDSLPLDRPPSTSLLPTVGAYLTPDLSEQCGSIYTGTLRRVIDALDSPQPLDARLYAAWQATPSEQQELVRFDGEHLIVEGAYALSEGPNVGASTSESGLTYRFYAGRFDSPIDEDLAALLHALLHDVRADRREFVQPPSPIPWPLASVVFDEHPSYVPWPAVQWPTRFDLQLQLRSWRLDAQRRKGPDQESASARARFFIASTVHIMRERALFEDYPGGWKEVIQKAHDVACSIVQEEATCGRSLAFLAWYEQLPRFALPRAGLGDRHAADILVRFHDITGKDARPELVGRVDKVNSRPLPFEVSDDHPAVRVAKCQTDEELRETLDDLRKIHDLG